MKNFFDKKKLLLRQSVISQCTKIWIHLHRTVCAMTIDSSVLLKISRGIKILYVLKLTSGKLNNAKSSNQYQTETQSHAVKCSGMK